jgi:hypothetical protein
MFEILQKILHEDQFNNMVHFKLDTNFIIDNNYKNIKTLLKNMNNNSNKNIRYIVSKTLQIDSINVIDIDDTRFIEFENDLYEYTNKGLDNTYELEI